MKSLKLHMIGKLQSNKAKDAVKLFDYIHSLDNQKLADLLFKTSAYIKKNLNILFRSILLMKCKNQECQ